MAKYLLISLLFFNLLWSNAVAQKKTHPYEIKSDTAQKTFPVPYSVLERLDDTSGKLTIAEMSSPLVSARFYPLKSNAVALSSKVNTYWLRTVIKNTMDKPARLLLYARRGITVYYLQLPGQKWQIQTLGSELPWNKKDGYKRFSSVYYEIPAKTEALLYKRISFDNYHLATVIAEKKTTGIELGNFDPFVKDELNNQNRYLLDKEFAALAGLLILAAIINLMFYRLIKDKVYLYFGIALLFTGIWLSNIMQEVFFANNPILLRYFGTELFGIVIMMSFWLFINAFFEFYKVFPRIARTMTWLTGLSCILIFTSQFFPETSFLSDVFSFIFLLSALLILSISLIHPKIRSKKKTLTILPVIAAFVYAALNSLSKEIFGVSFNQDYNAQLLWLCVCWLILSFMWGLLDRLVSTIRQSEADRSELIKQQNVLLEIKVNQRTEELKSSQHQLIQAEKMASLGELTAGIAHEIQNPLNFINNFSEVSMELIAEMNDELKSGNLEEGMLIAADVETNLQKINTHGKRADSIVKGMLQHSRTSSGKKEPTDVNALCDEFLRLSYHGLRAKDKLFNATLETYFTPEFPKPNLAAQEFGRVILNLFNNAFYSVSEKKRQNPDYSPKVSLSTALDNNQVVIRIKDNGIGIPQAVIDKIYQPFFTTKPTGQGTGLGLSLSYDIVTKMHGGELTVNTIEGEFAEFIIKLPL